MNQRKAIPKGLSRFMASLDEFIKEWRRFPDRAWVDYPGLDIYVRNGPVLIRQGEQSFMCSPCLTIAAIEAHDPGNGAFTKLIEDLRTRPFGVYVENAHNPRLRNKLVRMGFTKVNETHGPNYQLNCENFIGEHLG